MKAIIQIKSYVNKNGELTLYIHDLGIRENVRGLVELIQSKYNGYVKAELTPPYKPRTLPENAKYWAMCTEFGKHCCMTKEEVSMGVKYRAMEEGLWRGKTIPFSKNGEMMPDSSSTASTKEMAILIEVLYRIASEDGYVFDE